jgi:hypothetical protein
MSAAVKTPGRPVAGQRVKAIVTTNDGDIRPATISLPDGSIVITDEELAVLGDGDSRKGAREIRLMIANERDRAINETPPPRSASAQVRRATAADEDAIYKLLLIDIAENAAIVAPPNEGRIRGTIRQALNKPSVAGVIDGPDGTIVGVVMLVLMPWWWSMSWYFQEIPLFVHPDHRKSTYARQLDAFQRWWVDAMSASFGHRIFLLCGVLGTVGVRAKTAWYRRRYRQVGSIFLYPSPFTKGDKP